VKVRQKRNCCSSANGGSPGGIYLTPDTFQQDFVRVVGKIDAGTIWYGDDDEALEQIAEKARELGATAVMQVETWHQPSGFAWSAPHASGVAVVFTHPIPLDPRRGRVF